MTDIQGQDLTTQILIQIRDEMRAMRDSFERRFDALEARLDRIEARLDRLEATIDRIAGRVGSLEKQDLAKRFNQIDADLKKFASVANNAILHYAGEMDTVRERLQVIESKLGISYPPE